MKRHVWIPTIGHFSQQNAGKCLAKQGYRELPHTPGLFRHKTRQVWFTLVVDDFGIKYGGEENAKHSLGVLKEFYEMEEYWTRSLYCGITLNFHYKNQYVDIAMPNYVPNQLLKYGLPPPKRAQHTPFKPRPINYGTKSDTIIHEDPVKLIGDANKKYIQQVLGGFLYYARAIDMTILLALNEYQHSKQNPPR